MRHALDERLAHAVQALRALEAEVPERDGAVRTRDQAGIRWILLDNPGAHNALTVHMMRRLAEEIRGLADYDGALVALASANGGSFCAGGHLGQVRASLVKAEHARVMSTQMAAVLDALAALPVVSVSLLEGAAIGGGVELASATDLRMGTADCWLDPAQVRLGVACGWGGAARLARILGRRQALTFLARSARWSAQEALERGLLDGLVAGPEDLATSLFGVEDLAERAASVRAVKAQVAGHDPVEAFLSVWGSPHHRKILG